IRFSGPFPDLEGTYDPQKGRRYSNRRLLAQNSRNSLRGLQGDAANTRNQITWHGLIDFVVDNMSTDMQPLGLRQVPRVVALAPDDFILGTIPVAKTVMHTLGSGTRPDDRRQAASFTIGETASPLCETCSAVTPSSPRNKEDSANSAGGTFPLQTEPQKQCIANDSDGSLKDF